MKRIIIALSVLCTFLLSSCTALLTPTHAEDDSVLINVYDKTVGLDDGVRIAHAIFGIQEASRSEKLKSVEMLDWWNLIQVVMKGSLLILTVHYPPFKACCTKYSQRTPLNNRRSLFT